MKRFVLVFVTCSALAGCLGAEPPESDADACESYGAAPGTQAYFQCRMAKDQQREAVKAAVIGAYLSRPQQ